MSLQDYLNARAPYKFHISFSAYRSVSARQYIDMLRRLVYSINLRLVRKAKFRARSDVFGFGGLEMISGYVVMRCHEAKPQVEMIVNANSNHGVLAVVFVSQKRTVPTGYGFAAPTRFVVRLRASSTQ